MKKELLYVLLCIFFAACNNSEEANFSEVKDSSAVSFMAFIKQTSRATETTFEDGDAISVFAVSPTSPIITLAPSGNYADNVEYVYNGLKFDAGVKSITISPQDTTGLAYFAIYPYKSDASNKFSFGVKENQSNYANYTASDLCTAYNEPTRSESVMLEFKHRLSCVAIKLYGNNIASKDISAKLNDVYTMCNVDLNANTYTATGAKSSVIMGEHSTDTYQAIIVPQTIKAGETFAILTISGKETALTLPSDMELKSGKKTTIEVKIEDDKVVSINGFINPWSTADELLISVVPEEILEKIDDHMPLYSGVTPPNIEGAYLIDPFVAVYYEDHPDIAPGGRVVSETILFSNQDTKKNILDYNAISVTGSSWDEGKGAFISGTGDKFTAFFNTEGETYGIYTKDALVISGTKTSSGIEDLYYAFVMVEKGDDPSNRLMREGVFRIFKDEDGLCINTEWTADYSYGGTRSFSEIAECVSNGEYFK